MQRLDKATQQLGNSAKGRQESETHLFLMLGAHKNIKLTGITYILRGPGTDSFSL